MWSLQRAGRRTGAAGQDFRRQGRLVPQLVARQGQRRGAVQCHLLAACRDAGTHFDVVRGCHSVRICNDCWGVLQQRVERGIVVGGCAGAAGRLHSSSALEDLRAGRRPLTLGVQLYCHQVQ